MVLLQRQGFSENLESWLSSEKLVICEISHFTNFNRNYEILFNTRFSVIFSTILSTIVRKYKKLVYQYLSEQLLTTQLILHKTPYTPPSFKKKIALSMADVFRNIHFLPHFYYLSEWMRRAIFQMNTNLLII